MKNGFTLIELLAVIIILAIIALIATPIILDVIEEAEDSSNMSQAYLILNGADTFYAISKLNNTNSSEFDGKTNLYGSLDVSGEKPKNGSVFIDNHGNVALALFLNDKCYKKSSLENEIKIDESVTDALSCAPVVEEEIVVDPDESNCDFFNAYVNTTIDQTNFINEFSIGVKVLIDKNSQINKTDMAIFGNGSNLSLVFKGNTTILSETIDYTPYYGIWTDIVVTYNSESKEKNTYINNVLVETLENVVITETSEFYIGNNSTATTSSFIGEMSNFVIWNKEINVNSIDLSKVNDAYLNINMNNTADVESIGSIVGTYSCNKDTDTTPIPETYMKFTGSTYIETTANQNDFYQNFTIALKVNINRAEQSGIYYMGLFGNHSGSNGIAAMFSSYGTNLQATIDYNPYYDKWVDIVITYDRSTRTYHNYINGELKRTSTNTVYPYSGFYIGNSFTYENRKAKMFISQARIWDKTLTQEEVNQINLYSKEAVVRPEDVYMNMDFESMESISEFGTFQGSNYYFNN